MTLPIDPAYVIRPLITVKTGAQTSPAVLPFRTGDIIEVQILQKLQKDTYLIEVDRQRFTAHANLAEPLLGGKIKVQVESIIPTVVLRMVMDESALQGVINDNLRFWRINPRGLMEVFAALKEMTADRSSPVGRLLAGSNFESIVNLVNSILYTSDKTTDYLKGFIDLLGLTWEKSLARAALEGGVKRDTPLPLKALLHKLEGEMELILREAKLSNPSLSELSALKELVGKGHRMIESLQVMNVLLGETEGKYLLPIIFLQGQMVSQADLFIFKEPSGHKEGEGRPYRVVLCLELENIGGLVVDIGVRGSDLNVTILCKEEGTVNLVQENLPELADRLIGLGYVIKELSTRRDEDLKRWQEEFCSLPLFDGIELVNTFA